MAMATVTTTDGDIVRVRVRRNSRDETLYGRHADLKVGDRVEIKRTPNNPFPVRVSVDKFKTGSVWLVTNRRTGKRFTIHVQIVDNHGDVLFSNGHVRNKSNLDCTHYHFTYLGTGTNVRTN